MSKQRRGQQQPQAMSAASLDAMWAQSAAIPSTLAAGDHAGVGAVHGWEWALSTLVQLDDDKKCAVSIADSILLSTSSTATLNSTSTRKGGSHNNSVLWLVTHKNGAIVRKKMKQTGDSTSVFPAAEISERFVRLASRWRALGADGQYIAVVVLQDGKRQLLEPAEFQEWLDVLEGSSLQSDAAARIAGLQAYVPSSHKSAAGQSYITATYTAPASASSQQQPARVDITYRDYYAVPLHDSNSSIPQATGVFKSDGALISLVRKDAEQATQMIVDFLQRNSGEHVQRASLEFVVDCEQKLWLTHVERVVTIRDTKRNGEENNSSGNPLLSEQQSGFALGMRKQSLPNLPQAAQGGTSAISLNSGSSTSDGVSGGKCRGEFCRASPSLLPGLFFYSQNEGEDDASNNNGEGVVVTDTTILLDTGQRFKIGNNNVQLAHAEMNFILGKVSATGSESKSELALRWQEADNVLRMELGRTNPTQFYKQVPVCANCHRIYSELNRVRDNGFRKLGEVAPRGVKHSRSATTLKSKSSKSSSSNHCDVSKSNRIVDPSGEHYDQLFLAELAKQDELDGTSDGPEMANQPRSLTMSLSGSPQYRPELEDASMRPQSSNSNRAERPSLPSLSSTSSAAAQKIKKKTHGALSSSSMGVLASTMATRNSNNNQATGPLLGDEDDLRNLSGLKVRPTKVEEELAQTRGELSLSESQKRQLEEKLLQTQSQCTAMLQEKDDQVRKQLLEMEMAYHSKQSLQKHAGNTRSSSSASSADEMAKLIDTIDSRNFQIDQINAQKDHEKKQLAHSHQLEVKRLHEKYQVDMESLRLSEHTAKEQVEAIELQMLNLQNQVQVATTQARNAKNALEDLTKNKLASLEGKNRRLERQLAELKATQQQVKKGAAVSSSVSGSASFPSAQDLEALEKHMGNKIDYLKAQLASEMKCKEELGNHLAQVTGSMEQMKKEKRQALLEQEDTFKRQIQRLESNFAQEKEVMASQQASLQGKLVTLQANVTDLVQELTMWKSKEANARLSMEKMVEENVRVTRQIVDLENQVEALMEERKHDGGNSSMSVKNASDETQRMQMEALLRRLDNERQYLKNQLENEQEMKEKNQRQVSTLQSEVDQLKHQLEQATKESEMKLSALSAEKLSAERQFQESIECLEESKVLLMRQFKEVQAKFAQAREQSLIDRDELEKMRIDTIEMRSQLAATKEELVKEKEYGKNASERSSKSLTLVKNSLKAMEEEKNIRIQRLEEENAMFMGKLANTQAEMLVLEEKWVKDKAQIKKQHALTVLAFVLREKLPKHCLKKQSQCFHRLSLISNSLRLQSLLECKHNAEVNELEERLSKDFMDKCDQMTQSLHDERIDAIRQMKERHDKDREELHLYYEQEKSQLLEETEFAHTQRVQELEQKHQLSLKTLEESASQAIDGMEAKYGLLQKDRNSAVEAFAETQRRCEQLSSTLEARSTESSQEREARELLWRNEKEEMLRIHGQQLTESEAFMLVRVEELEHEHQFQIQSMKEEHARARTLLTEKAAEEVRAQAQEEKQALLIAHEEQLAEVDAQHRSRMDEEIQQINLRWQQEIQNERDVHEKKLRDALERVESKAQGQLDALQKEMNDRKGHAIVQCTSKWQKALEELQERLEVEKKVTYESGLQDRENEWQQAALQIKQKQKEELESVQKEALRAIQATEERHKIQFQAKFAQLTWEFEEKHANEVLRLTTEITEREQQSAQAALEVQLKELEQEAEEKHARALDNLKDDYQQKREQELAKLSAGFENEKQELLEHFEAIKEKELMDLEKEWMGKVEQLNQEKDSQTQHALEELRNELSSDYEHDTQQLRDALRDEMEVRLKELETRLLNEQDEAIAQVQEDSEKLIEKVELAMTQLKTQKDAMEKELVKLRSALEEAEDSHFDVEEQMKKQRKQMTFHFLTLLMHARKRIEDGKHTHTATVMEFQAKQDSLENDRTREKKKWNDEMTQIRTMWSQMQLKHDEMLKMLTNYKRDELVAHRSASGVLSNEISIVTKQMDEVNEMKAGLEREIEQLQAEAQQVEANLRQLMVQNSSSSAESSSSNNSSSGGSLNMAVVAKKRRLNEEFEALLEQMEKKKAEGRNVEKTFAALRSRREAKEQEMKAMERKLVEILVQQQKHMLALLTSIRELAVPSPLIVPISA